MRLSLFGDGSDGLWDPWLQVQQPDSDEAALFRYYAPPTLVNVTPTSSSVGIGQVLTLRGSGFASGCGYAPTCRLGSATTAWETSAATVVSDGEVHCAALVGTGPSEVQLSLNDGADFTGGDTPVRHTLEEQWHSVCYPWYPTCGPRTQVIHTFEGNYVPTINSARFSSSGSKLLIDFGAQPTNTADMGVGVVSSCKEVLAVATIAALGGAAITCRWQSETLLTVLLSGMHTYMYLLDVCVCLCVHVHAHACARASSRRHFVERAHCG